MQVPAEVAREAFARLDTAARTNALREAAQVVATL